MATTSRDTVELTADQVAALDLALEREMRHLAPNASRGTRDYREIERSVTDWLIYRLETVYGTRRPVIGHLRKAP